VGESGTEKRFGHSIASAPLPLVERAKAGTLSINLAVQCFWPPLKGSWAWAHVSYLASVDVMFVMTTQPSFFREFRALAIGFKEFCAANGIRMEKTIPGTPQQNGVAERMNRTLNERARSMRLHAGLPKTFWADAVSTAAYLINRGPSVPLNCRLPEEVWSGKVIKLSYSKVFWLFILCSHWF